MDCVLCDSCRFGYRWHYNTLGMEFNILMKKYLPYFIILFLLFSFIAEGVTEGYVWADSERRIENPVIKGGAEGKGFLDYHGYRAFETFFLFFASACLLGLGGLGTSMIGLFVYERLLNFVDKGIWFKPDGYEYYIAGFTIKRYAYQDWLILVIGVGLIAYYFIKKQRRQSWNG